MPPKRKRTTTTTTTTTQQLKDAADTVGTGGGRPRRAAAVAAEKRRRGKEEEEEDILSDDEEEEVRTVKKKPAPSRARKPAKTKSVKEEESSSDEDEASDEDEDDDEEDEDEAKLRKQRKEKEPADSDEEDEEKEASSSVDSSSSVSLEPSPSSDALDESSDKPIYFFGHTGAYGCLSNRCACYPFKGPDGTYASVEHWFQSQKFYPDVESMKDIRTAKSPELAAKFGKAKIKKKPIRSDWEKVKVDVMRQGMKLRFEQHQTLAALLVVSGKRQLRFGGEKSNFKDPFWGWDNGTGENKMGELLMSLRKEFVKKFEDEGLDAKGIVEEARSKKEDDNYVIEYSRTKTATCKQCETKLEKSVLRIGKRAIIRNSLSFLWFHWECFFKRYSVESVERWKGFKDLEKEDQQKVVALAKETFGEQSGGRTALTSSTGHVKEYTADCVAGYAPSARSSCKWCKTTIPRDALRIGPNIKSYRFDGKMTVWHHVACFFEKYEVAWVDAVSGLNTLRWEDQETIRKNVKGSGNKPSAAPAVEDDSSKAKGKGKKRKGEEEPPKDESKELADKLWVIKDALQKHCSKQGLKEMLELNNTDSSGGMATLVEKCADGMLYGPLGLCPDCKEGRLNLRGGGMYVCNRWISEWSRCSYWSSDIKRLDNWKIPESLKSIEFLRDFKFVKHTSIVIAPSPKKEAQNKRRKTSSSSSSSSSSSKKTAVNNSSSATGVHPGFKRADEYHIYTETVAGKEVAFNATLNMSEVAMGINSYYVLQLLERNEDADEDEDENEDVPTYCVFKKWGRVGTDVGSSSTLKFDELAKAKKEFNAEFLKKTGNIWDKRDKFEKKAGKYFLVDIDYKTDVSLLDGLNLKDKKHQLASKLSKPLQELIGLIFDVEVMEKTLQELEFDAEKTPLGMLSKSQIEKGNGILSKIQDLLDKPESASQTKLRDLSNQFYTIIPHTFSKRASDMVISSKKELKKKIEMLDALRQIQVAYSLLTSGASSGDGAAIDPLEANYKKLHTELEALPHDSEEFEMIKTYIADTSSAPGYYPSYQSLELLDVFSVERQGERDRFEKATKKLDNHMLLVHGSRVTNFAGILSQGLKIAPPDVPASGYLFGKGLYFADMFAKSANYCRVTRESDVGLLLLSEVALGKPYEIQSPEFMKQPPKGFDCTKGVGEIFPDPKGHVEQEDGYKVPLGKPLTKKAQLKFNEYIVYDEHRVYNRYLLKVRFHFNKKA